MNGGWDWKDVSNSVFGTNSDDTYEEGLPSLAAEYPPVQQEPEKGGSSDSYLLDFFESPKQSSSINRIEPAHQGDMQARYPEIAINVSHRVRKEERQAWVWEDVCEGDWMRTTKQRGKVVKVTAISDARIPKEEILFFLLDGSSHIEATADSNNNNNNNNNNAIRRWGDGRKGKLIEGGLEVESVTGPIEHVVGGRTFYGYEVKAKINVLCKNLLVCAGLKHFGSDVVLGHSVCFRTHDNGRKRKRTKGIDDPSVERKHSDRKGGVPIVGGENGINNNGNNNNNNGHLTDHEESGGSTPEGRTPPSGSESAEDLHKDRPPMFHVLKMENASSSPPYPPPPMPALSFAENRNSNLYPTTTTTTTSNSLPSVQRNYPAQNVQGNPLYMRSELPSTSNRHSDYYPEHMPYSCENADARKSFPEPYSYSANQQPILDPTTAYLAQRVKNSLHAYGMEVSGDLRVDGIVRAHGFAQYSDMRLKTNIAEITDALEMVTQLKGKTYSWKPGSEMAEKDGRARILGFLAQEVKRVVPEVVQETEDGVLTVAYAELIPLLVAAFNQHLTHFYSTQKQQEKDFADFKDEVWNYVTRKDEPPQHPLPADASSTPLNLNFAPIDRAKDVKSQTEPSEAVILEMEPLPVNNSDKTAKRTSFHSSSRPRGFVPAIQVDEGDYEQRCNRRGVFGTILIVGLSCVCVVIVCAIIFGIVFGVRDRTKSEETVTTHSADSHSITPSPTTPLKSSSRSPSPSATPHVSKG